MRAVTRRWMALRSALVVVFAVLASYGDNLFNLSAHELKGGKGDGSGWGGADEVGAAPAVKCCDAALAVNAANEVADAAKRTEAVDVHVGSNHLVWVRHRRCDHLGKGAREHEVYRGDFVEEHAALSGERHLDGFVERKLNDDVRDAHERRTKAAVQTLQSLFTRHSRQSVDGGGVMRAFGHRRRQRLRVLDL